MTDEVPLQPSIEELITKICSTRCLPPPSNFARLSLSRLSEATAIEILIKIGNSKEIREFSGFICYMAKKASPVAVTSPKEDRVLPQKRSPPISVTDGSPQSISKSAHFISPNSKQSLASPSSGLNPRTIPDYFPRSPNNGYVSSNSKHISPVPFLGFEDAIPDAYQLAESSNATNRVQKQLIFSPGCDLDETNHSKASQHLFDSSNTGHRFSMIQEKQIISPCSSSMDTKRSYFYDASSATHNGSLMPHQHGIGGPTNSQHLFDSSNTRHQVSVNQEKQIISPCSSSRSTKPSHFYDTGATNNGALMPHQHSLTHCENIGGPTNSQHLFDSSNTRHQVAVNQGKQIISPCSSSKCTKPSHFYDTSSARQNGSLMPHQHSGGPTNSLAISQQKLLQQNQIISPCSSSRSTKPSHFYDTGATHNGSLVPHQHSGGPTNSLAISQQKLLQEKQILSPCSSSKGTNHSHFYDTSSGGQNGSLMPHQHSGGPTNSLAISQQTFLLAELEFRKMFLVYSYVGRRKLEDVVSVKEAIEIKEMKTMTMVDFEANIWAKYGCRFIERGDRAMHLDWDSGKTHLYHCYVDTDGALQFKGPYLNTRRTHVQRELGDENVLIVQFVDDQNSYDGPSNYSSPIAVHQRLSSGISIGLRQYRLFAFKEADRKKNKDYTTKKPQWAVKCYFIRKESHAPWTEKDDCVLLKKTNHEARCLFMHVHMVSSMAKYVARCQLALSNSIKLRVDLTSVNVERIEDIPCRDEYGNVVCNEDNEPLIHTDGTGFISEDLAILCAKDFFEADGSKDDGYEFVDLLKLEEESLGVNGQKFCIREPPLLVQCRLFKDGYAVKGTLLVNKKLKNRTIQVRPSMIKVEKDDELKDSTSFSSLEIVSVSRKPRKAALSKNLIALLAAGGVPKSYFLELLEIALQDAQKVSSSMRAALRVGLNYAQMDDSATSVSMIGSGIPLDEPYLQYRLSILANEERKGLRSGRIPVNESYYLIGTADPTGTLNNDEVCVILENGQISGKVLVYRNPGLDFGDIHVLNAKYIEKLEEFVGNAKYGIFFSTKGKRSVGAEIANGDFDGDTYWVCRNPQLLHYFKASEPWKRKYSTPSAPRKKPKELSFEEIETQIFAQLFATQKHGKVAGIAADSWQAFMDQYLVLGENDVDEKRRIKEKLLKLADLYYDALDAPKSGKTIDISRSLLPEKYPHYLEKYNKSYNSSSVLGEIYDRAKTYQPDNALIREIWKLPCFNVEIPGPILNLWKNRYESYKQDMSKAMQSGDESKNNSANLVINKYKQMLYEAENFASSTRKPEDIYNDALAIYHASYDYAIKCADLRKCGFAWKVAGEALCSFHESRTPGKSLPFKLNVLSMFI